MSPNMRIAFFLPSLAGGGGQKVTLDIIRGLLDEGFHVELVLSRAEGPLLNRVPERCSIIDLDSSRTATSFYKLIRYLREESPDFIISGLNHANILAIISASLARVPTKVIITIHGVITRKNEKKSLFKSRLLLSLMKLTFFKASAIIAVSKGVAKDLCRNLNLDKDKVFVIYNPVVDDKLIIKAQEGVEMLWFKEKESPVILSAGRLTDVKDYSTLIRAFAKVRESVNCRLVILGEGEEREQLQNLASGLGVQKHLWMPGFVDNPYKYMRKSDLFVLSSKREGLPTVLIEAMACGTPIIASKSPGGTTEVLENGKYGHLFEVGDVDGLAKLICIMLDGSASMKNMQEWSQKFSIENAIVEYKKLLEYLGG